MSTCPVDEAVKKELSVYLGEGLARLVNEYRGACAPFFIGNGVVSECGCWDEDTRARRYSVDLDKEKMLNLQKAAPGDFDRVFEFLYRSNRMAGWNIQRLIRRDFASLGLPCPR